MSQAISLTTAAEAKAREPLRIEVPLGSRRYEVLIGEGLIESAGTHVAAVTRSRRALVVTDEIVAALHLRALRGALERSGLDLAACVVSPGEASKSFEVLERVVDAALEAKLERSDLIIALGGGVVGDLAGFAAAIVRRGMPFVQVPTTLLAQVDSAVGGKTGINAARHGKNLVGAFHQPALVLADTGALATLPERERCAGYAEIVKIALIGDRPFFERLERAEAHAPHRHIAEAIATAVSAKAAIVVEDERESGRRALLNLGHTFAHAVERCAGYDGRIIHGEAVAVGLCLAFRLSVRLGLCPAADAQRVAAHLTAVGLPCEFRHLPVPIRASALTAAMAQDKKVKDGIIRFILVRGIGKAFVSDGVDPEVLAAFLAEEGLASP